MKNLILGFLALAALTSCSHKTKTLWVGGYKTDCSAGAGKAKCLNVSSEKNLDDAQWQSFYAPIDGFQFDEGYYQRIEVEEKKISSPPADGSSIAYKLKKVLQKDEDKRVDLNGDWLAVRVNGNPIGRKYTAPYLSIDLQSKQVAGLDGCNQFTGMIKNVTVTRLELGNMAANQKMCMDMTMADQFNKAAGMTRFYKFNNDQLIFTDADKKETLAFIPKPKESMMPSEKMSNEELLSHKWVAVSVNGRKLNRMTKVPSITFDVANNTFSGSDGCNTFTGNFDEVTNTILILGTMATTEKMCPGMDMEVGEDFNAVLAATASYTVDQKMLQLYGPQGNVIAKLIPAMK